MTSLLSCVNLDIVKPQIQHLETLLACSTCQSVPIEDVTIFSVATCNHFFCSRCVKDTIAANKCPHCLTDVNPKFVYRDEVLTSRVTGLNLLKSTLGITTEEVIKAIAVSSFEPNGVGATRSNDAVTKTDASGSDSSASPVRKSRKAAKSGDSRPIVGVKKNGGMKVQEVMASDPREGENSEKSTEVSVVLTPLEELPDTIVAAALKAAKGRKKNNRSRRPSGEAPATSASETVASMTSGATVSSATESSLMPPPSIRSSRRAKTTSATSGVKTKLSSSGAKKSQPKSTSRSGSAKSPSPAGRGSNQPQDSTPDKLNKKNKKGETQLQCACIKVNVDEVRRLLQLGADPNTQDNNKWTPLHEAAQRNAFEIVSLLLEHGANPNVPGGESNLTPLHDAVSYGSLEVAKILIQNGAKKTIKDSHGLLPSDYASTDEMRQCLAQTECEVSTEQLDQSIRQNNVHRQIVLTQSPDLSDSLVEKFKEAKAKLSFKLLPKLSEATSHVIVTTFTATNSDSDDGILVTKETPFYFEALLSGKPIVTWAWIEASLTAGEWVDEEEYMVQGTRSCPSGAPQKSVNNEFKQWPRLFTGFNIYLEGQFGPPYPNNSELTKVLRCGGANILSRKPDPESIPTIEATIPFHASEKSSLAQCSHLIIYQEGTGREPQLKYNMKHVKSLPAAWLFNCFNAFEIVDEFR